MEYKPEELLKECKELNPVDDFIDPLKIEAARAGLMTKLNDREVDVMKTGHFLWTYEDPILENKNEEVWIVAMFNEEEMVDVLTMEVERRLTGIASPDFRGNTVFNDEFRWHLDNIHSLTGNKELAKKIADKAVNALETEEFHEEGYEESYEVIRQIEPIVERMFLETKMPPKPEKRNRLKR